MSSPEIKVSDPKKLETTETKEIPDNRNESKNEISLERNKDPQERIKVAVGILNEYFMVRSDLEVIGVTDEDMGEAEKEKQKALEVLQSSPQAEILRFVRNPEYAQPAFELFFEPVEGKENTYRIDFRGINENLLGLGHFDAFVGDEKNHFDYVRVNGKLGARQIKANFNKPGYFDESGNYMAVFTGDTVERLTEEQLSKEEKDKFQNVQVVDWNEWKDNAEKVNDEYQEDIETLEKDEQELIQAGAEPLSGQKLLDKPEFSQELNRVCARLGVNRDHLVTVMTKESGINTKKVNPKSNATGLIQFMPSTIRKRGWNISIGDLRKLSGFDQLKYVEMYYEPYKGKLNSLEDLYLATFYPAAIGRSDEFVLGSELSQARVERIGAQNPTMNGGRPITKGHVKKWINR